MVHGDEAETVREWLFLLPLQFCDQVIALKRRLTPVSAAGFTSFEFFISVHVSFTVTNGLELYSNETA